MPGSTAGLHLDFLKFTDLGDGLVLVENRFQGAALSLECLQDRSPDSCQIELSSLVGKQDTDCQGQP